MTRFWGRSSLVWVSPFAVAVATSCGTSPAPAPATAAASPASVATVDVTPPPAPETTTSEAGSPTATPPEAPPAPPPPSFVDLCNQMCDRVARRCSESATEGCRMNCTQYEHPPAGCDPQVRLALECAAKAEDLTCVNIAPESCAADFRRVVACASGKPEGAMPEDPTKVPDGWQRFETKTGGFATPMPSGVSEKTAAPPTYVATSGEAEYEVRWVEAPPEKPTQKNLVRVVLGLVGNCARNLKLFGMVERPDRTTIRYESRCADGAERHGMLVIAAGKMHVLEIRGPKGMQAPKDPFFYNFELR